MTREIQNLISDYLRGNRGPGYEVMVTGIAEDLSHIDVSLTFGAGSTYCCAEPFCHVPHDLFKLITFAAERGIVLPQALVVHWHFVVEEGALLECNRALGAPLAAKRQEYDEMTGSTG